MNTENQRLEAFKAGLKALLVKHNAELTFMLSPCSDTHGIQEEGIGVEFNRNNKEIRLSHGYGLDSSDIEINA